MQKLARYNYIVKYKARIQNIAIDALNHHPDHMDTQYQFVYFANYKGFLLVSAQYVYNYSTIIAKFHHTILPKHGIIRTNIFCTSIIDLKVSVA